ncbi:very long-chain acyl-CoA synthetase-like [Pomacea canaliculata]|uniref:very long-chain acyl-CoA synthetase-like n=1 Tax=Pomacea canaliculata TaxID=400727 RepID=UPI000D72C88F|nr:very long-chain acyl-CoA synthetase-like [Pomacea canaliculata]
MPGMLDKVLIGTASAAGVGVVAWQTKFPWIKYDIQLIKLGQRLNKMRQEVLNSFLIDKFESQADKQPKKAMLIFEDSVYTYEFIELQSNRVANAVRCLGLGFGDTVAMMIHNEPAFVWTFLGLQKLGISVAFINFNLRAKLLVHSILASDPKAIFIGPGFDLLHAVSDVLDDIQGLPIYIQGCTGHEVPLGMNDFGYLMGQSLPVRTDRSVRKDMTMESILCYIYTSGTTGLPKPALISQGKGCLAAIALQTVNLSAEDVVYTCLPLYHSSGSGIGLWGVIERGATMILVKKFSAKHFWPDCRKHGATIIQYIGEILRYVLAHPPNELDGVHNVRAAIGNGLRKDIFMAVQERFKIPFICEIFGATEGVTITVNIANKPGAIGRLSPLLSKIDPVPKALVKFDYATAQPIRDKNGHCIKVKIGEPGLFLSKIPDEMRQAKETYKVYKTSQEASEKKLVRNAFADGDLYFNFGDVFYLDKDYFLYFHDRIGDTFRWKGENVSTTEVANILSLLPFISDANVYGVQVPGHDGRAGMAAITLKEGDKITEAQLKQLYRLCEDDLASYARPLFLRILSQSVLTSTFKQLKIDLVQEGYDLTKVTDPLYYRNSSAQTYSTLTAQVLPTFLQSRL